MSDTVTGLCGGLDAAFYIFYDVLSGFYHAAHFLRMTDVLMTGIYDLYILYANKRCRWGL